MNSATVHRNLRKTIMCEKIKSRAQKNRMYGHHIWANLCSSEGINVAAAPGSSQSVTQPLQFPPKIQIASQYSDSVDRISPVTSGFGVPRTREIGKWMVFIVNRSDKCQMFILFHLKKNENMSKNENLYRKSTSREVNFL